MKPGTWTFTGWALAISTTLGVLLLALIFHLNSRAEAQKGALEKAKQDYDMVTKLRIRYRELEGRKNRMPVIKDQGNQSPQVFLAQKAAEAQLPQPVIVPELPGRGLLKEHAFTVSLSPGAAAPVSRRQFVKFLDAVESERPGFKSKNINLTFSSSQPEDLSQATATFSQFDR